MKEYSNVIVLIPAFNPSEKLIELTDELKDKKINIIIVDDGSNNQDIFNKLDKKIAIIHHEENKGKGRAIKTGLSYIKENFNKDYIIVTMDADGQHKVKDALKLIEYCHNNPNSLVLGSRKLDKNVPFKSKIGNTITKNVYKMVTKNNINDTQTGLRAFSINLVDRLLNIKGERYEYEINMLLELNSEVPIKEVEIETIYIDNNKESHFNPVKDSYRIYKEIIKFCFSSILSFILDFILYSIFLIVFKTNPYHIQISNITARIFSATFNYTVNKKLVFKHTNSIVKSASSYAILAIFILITNTCILTILTNFGINKLIAKIITEVILFVISYTIQHTIIFKNNKSIN